MELTLRDAAGTAYPIYVDYDVQLIYGLFDVYADIAAKSGAVVYLEKTTEPAEYQFVSSNETDPGVFVSPARLEELLDFRAEVEGGSADLDLRHRAPHSGPLPQRLLVPDPADRSELSAPHPAPPAGKRPQRLLRLPSPRQPLDL